MTIASETNKIIYTGDNLTSIFSYPFKIFANTELQVIEIVIATKVETVLTLTTDYTVDGVDNPDGGNVTLVAGALASTKKLVIKRVPAFLQNTNYIENDDFPAESHEDALDKLTMICQDLKEQVARMVLQPITESDQITISKGLDASKPTTPGVGDIYVATDTLKLYVCFVAAAWVAIN